MPPADLDRPLSRTEASEAVESIGWRYLLGTLAASVPVTSLDEATNVAQAVLVALGQDGDGHLRVDLRPDRVELSLQTRSKSMVTAGDTALAHTVSAVLSERGCRVAASVTSAYPRPVGMLEIAIDAIDIQAIRPFWKAAFGFIDDPADPGSEGALVDPAGQLPAIWFQQMSEPRPQRNRIHFDITVAHDEAEPRVAAVVAAGGRLIDDSYARMFWVLADAEGNECCICTWTDRDEWHRAHPGE